MSESIESIGAGLSKVVRETFTWHINEDVLSDLEKSPIRERATLAPMLRQGWAPGAIETCHPAALYFMSSEVAPNVIAHYLANAADPLYNPDWQMGSPWTDEILQFLDGRTDNARVWDILNQLTVLQLRCVVSIVQLLQCLPDYAEQALLIQRSTFSSVATLLTDAQRDALHHHIDDLRRTDFLEEVP